MPTTSTLIQYNHLIPKHKTIKNQHSPKMIGSLERSKKVKMLTSFKSFSKASQKKTEFLQGLSLQSRTRTK
jgi:hypothetical protein